MKKYLLFAGSQYYPDGGMRDFVKDADSAFELVNLVLIISVERPLKITDYKGDVREVTPGDGFWWEVVDRDSLEVIEKGKQDV